MVYKFFDKKTESGATVTSKAGISINELELAIELHKPVIKKLEKRKFYARFKDNFCIADFVEMGSFSTKNKIGKYLICVTDIFLKYLCVNPLKDKKSKTVLNAFIEILTESNRKPHNCGLIKEENFKLMQEWLANNDILMYSTCNECYSVINQRFIKALKVKLYKK